VADLVDPDVLVDDLLGQVMPGARLQPGAGGEGQVQLVLGTSFDGTIMAPETGGPAPVDPPAVRCP